MQIRRGAQKDEIDLAGQKLLVMREQLGNVQLLPPLLKQLLIKVTKRCYLQPVKSLYVPEIALVSSI